MSEWETFCDRSYYDLWRVRRKNERGFNDGYHIHNGEEARALVELLNGHERERDEARDKIERQAERIRYLEGATNHATGTPLSVALRERDAERALAEMYRRKYSRLTGEHEALQEQLDAAIMLGKMQERRHERELEQVREQYRLSSVYRKLLEENKQMKGES